MLGFFGGVTPDHHVVGLETGVGEACRAHESALGTSVNRGETARSGLCHALGRINAFLLQPPTHGPMVVGLPQFDVAAGRVNCEPVVHA